MCTLDSDSPAPPSLGAPGLYLEPPVSICITADMRLEGLRTKDSHFHSDVIGQRQSHMTTAASHRVGLCAPPAGGGTMHLGTVTVAGAVSSFWTKIS